jgi:hypothetical protein
VGENVFTRQRFPTFYRYAWPAPRRALLFLGCDSPSQKVDPTRQRPSLPRPLGNADATRARSPGAAHSEAA